MKRVVVTGIGLLTSLGINSGIIWSNLLNRKSGIKKIKNFDVSDLTCKIAGYISHDQDDEHFYDRSLHLENKVINSNTVFKNLENSLNCDKYTITEHDKLPRNLSTEQILIRLQF